MGSQAESDHEAVRRLLTYAAKAAGYEFVAYRRPVQDGNSKLDTTWSGAWAEVKKPNAPLGNCRWNPLEYDGDAFRLAVMLGLDINAYPASSETSACKFSCGVTHRCIERTDDDPYAATRLAITRAAAEIGKSMP